MEIASITKGLDPFSFGTLSNYYMKHFSSAAELCSEVGGGERRQLLAGLELLLLVYWLLRGLFYDPLKFC